MTNKTRNHNDKCTGAVHRAQSEGSGINRFPEIEHNPILEELAAHVEDLIRITTGRHANNKIKEFRAAFADITDSQHRAYIIELHRRHYSKVLNQHKP